MPKSLTIKVNTMDAELEFSITTSTLGKVLFEQVNKTINIREAWWFGLQYEDNQGYKQWLKLKTKVSAQDIPGLKENGVAVLKYRTNYLPEDAATELIQHITIRMIFLEIKDAILSDEIYCPADASVLLASFAAQAKYEDYQTGFDQLLMDSTQLCKRIVDQHTLSQKEWVQKIVVWWKEHAGMLKEDAMIEYLKIAQDLEMYGVNYFDIKNNKGTELYLGVDALGLNIYERTDKLTPKIGFPWSEIRNVSFKDKRFIIKSADKKAPDFVFLAPRTRINKQIVALCMGNHELYARRRRDDPVEIQQLRVHAEEEKKFKLVERERLLKERRSRQEAEDRLRDLEVRLREQSSRQESAQQSLEDFQQRCSRLELELEAEARHRRELEAMHRELESSKAALEQARSQDSAEYHRLLEENARIGAEIALKNQAISQSSQQLADFQAEMDRLRLEREKAAVVVAGSGEAPPLLVDLPELDDAGSLGHDLDPGTGGVLNRSEEDRETAIDKDQSLQNKLKELSKDLQGQRDESRMNTSDIQHEENRRAGRDKFKTLKQIRLGNTKKRVDAFESM